MAEAISRELDALREGDHEVAGMFGHGEIGMEDASPTDMAKHAALLGSFNLATFFMNASFGTSNLFGCIQDVTALQVILGAVPVPTCGAMADALPNLRQGNPAALFSRDFPAALSGPNATADPRPLIMVVQMKLGSLAKASSPGSITLPVLFAANEILGQSADARGQQVAGLVVATYGWCDYCVVLRGRNTETMFRCVQRLTALTLDHIMECWQQADDCARRFDKRLADSIKSQGVAFRGRLGAKAALCIKAVSGEDACADWQTIVHSGLFTTVATHFGVDLELLDALGEGAAADGLGIEGQLNGYLRISHEASRGPWVRRALREEFERIDMGAITLGRHDKTIPFSCLTPALLPPPPDHDSVRSWLTVGELLDCYRRVRRVCFGDQPLPRSAGLGVCELSAVVECRDTLDQGSGGGVSGLGGGCPSIEDAFADHLVCFCRNGDEDIEKLLQKMKELGIERHERRAFKEIVQLWQRELCSGTDPGHMLELAEFIRVWTRGIASFSGGESTAVILDWIEDFGMPLWKSVTRRAMTGFALSEHSDYTLEFKGGMYKLMTGFDGFVKAILSLCAGPGHYAGLTEISHRDSASLSCMVIPLKDGDKDLEFGSVVCKIDFTHLVHPLKFVDLLHEMMHAIACTKSFQNLLLKHTGSLFADMVAGGSPASTSLYRTRLQEVMIIYMVGWLLFEDDPGLYSSAALVLLGLNRNSHMGDEGENAILVADHMCRLYLSFLMMSEGSVDPGKEVRDFEGWLAEHKRYAGPEDVPWRRKSLEYARKLLAVLLEDDVVIRTCNGIVKATKGYFQRGLRQEFLRTWRGARDALASAGIKFFDGDIPHLVFHDPTRLNVGIRERRLEALVSFLAIGRRYCQELFDDILPKTGDVFIGRDGNNGVDGAPANLQIGLDWLSGAAFSVGRENGIRYTRGRLVFITAIWHVAEVLKLAEYGHYCKEWEGLQKGGGTERSVFFGEAVQSIVDEDDSADGEGEAD